MFTAIIQGMSKFRSCIVALYFITLFFTKCIEKVGFTRTFLFVYKQMHVCLKIAKRTCICPTIVTVFSAEINTTRECYGCSVFRNRISLLVHRDICRYKHTRILDCERKQTLKLVGAAIGFSFVQSRTSALDNPEGEADLSTQGK